MRGGGRLLIADHAPFGTAAEALAARLWVNMAPGNAQFGLNIMHWLTGLLP